MLESALQKIGFPDRYRSFTNMSDCAENFEQPDPAVLLSLLQEIDPSVKFFKKEKFYRFVRREKQRIFWIHLEVDPVINFLFYEMDEKGKYVDGSPLVAQYRKLNGGALTGLGRLHYCSHEEFVRIAKAGYELCTDIIRAYEDA